MDGLQDEARLEEQGAQQQAAQRDGQGKLSQAHVSAAATGGNAAAQACANYETALAERDTHIAKLEGKIAEAAKTAEGAEALRKEMDELCRRSDEERVGFELQLAGARNIKAARALLADHDNDVEKLKAAEPWLFGARAAAPAQAGATGLPNASAAGADESTQVSRWRKIAGLLESEE